MIGPEETRRRAAGQWWPDRLRLLLVAEAPPAAPDRYFYFEHVSGHDSLFRYVCKGLFGAIPARTAKATWLGRLQAEGIGLVDVSVHPLPVPGAPLAAHVPALVTRVSALAPEAVILIKATVYDVAFGALARAGQPVADVRIPFPGSGQQRRFEEAFGRALDLVGIGRRT